METSPLSPRLTALKDDLAAGNGSALEAFWQGLATDGTPLIEPIADDPEHSLVTFVWRAGGEKEVPAVVSALPGRDTTDPMDLLPGTDVWHKTYRVRSDTRESYQFAIEGEHVTDPLNPRRHVFPDDDEAGFKGWVSSVLELPQALAQRWSLVRPEVPAGKISLHRLPSAILERDYRVWVYTPPDYSPDAGPYGWLLFLDGSFYLDPAGAAASLDNLRADGLLLPMVALFVGSSFDQTRRRDLVCYPPFRQFLMEELVPWAQAHYSISTDPARSALVGSSLGGLMTAYVGLHHSEVFGNLLCQSSYFGWRSKAEPEDGWIIRQYVGGDRRPLRFWIDVGRLETALDTWEPGFGNFLAGARHMRDVLMAKGYEVHYYEHSGGHNAMNAPDMLPLGLMALLGTPAAQAELGALHSRQPA